MSQIVLELPPSVYSALLKAAQETGTTPVDWITSHLSATAPADSRGIFEDETQLGRIQGLAYYLGTVTAAREIAPETAALALQAWNELHKAARFLPVPDASAGPEGQLLYTWDKEEHHLELEIYPNGSAELFYRNRRSGELWEHDYAVGDLLPPDVTVKLRVFDQTDG